MNVHANRVDVTIPELKALAVELGHNTDTLSHMEGHLHNDGLFGSHLRLLLKDALFSLFAAGFLLVDTRPKSGPDMPTPEFDHDAFEMLTGRTMRGATCPGS